MIAMPRVCGSSGFGLPGARVRWCGSEGDAI